MRICVINPVPEGFVEPVPIRSEIVCPDRADMWETGHMFQLIYASRLADDLTGDAIRTLVEDARDANQKTGVTGIMAISERTLLQALEGEENTVRTFYRRIMQDDRHEDCEILLTRRCETRSFPNSPMTVCQSDDEDYMLKIVIAELKTHRDRLAEHSKTAARPVD